MPNDQKNKSTQANKTKGMQDDKNKSGSKVPGQSTTGSGNSGSSGNRENNGKNK